MHHTHNLSPRKLCLAKAVIIKIHIRGKKKNVTITKKFRLQHSQKHSMQVWREVNVVIRCDNAFPPQAAMERISVFITHSSIVISSAKWNNAMGFRVYCVYREEKVKVSIYNTTCLFYHILVKQRRNNFGGCALIVLRWVTGIFKSNTTSLILEEFRKTNWHYDVS